MKATGGQANGVFIDGTKYRPLVNCHYKTCGEDQDQCCVFSDSADLDYNEGLKLVKKKPNVQFELHIITVSKET